MAKSKFLKLKNTKLTDYVEVLTNRALTIDDISGEFSSSESNRDEYVSTISIDPNNNFNRFLVQVVDSTGQFFQASEIITLNDQSNIFNLIKNSITSINNTPIANIEATIDSFGGMYLQFYPDNPYDYDYNIKIIQNNFLTRLSSTNKVSIGFVDLSAFNGNVPSGSTLSIVNLDKTITNSLHLSVNLIDSTLEWKNYVELYVVHDGTDAYITELFFDDLDNFNSRFIGSFSAYIDNNQLKVDYENNSSNPISIRCRNILFNDDSVGVGTYRFLADDQPEGSERSAIYDSQVFLGVSPNPIEVFTINKNDFTTVKSIVKIDSAEGMAMHQLLTVQGNNNVNVSQYPFLSIGSTNGIGTFSGQYSGNDLTLYFYPNADVTGQVQVLSFNEKIYTEADFFNVYDNLSYFPNSESIKSSIYYGINSSQVDKVEFGIYNNGVSIFSKRFNPNSNIILNKESGIFTIKNHFFSNYERLIYTPKSTFANVGEQPLGIGATLNSVGIVTDKLPEEVYVIKINPDQFRLSTRKDYAQAGIYVTFTSSGEGNSHQLEMYKKNEKTIISVNDLIQYPILYTSLEYNLEGNGGQIGAATTIFSLSGIASVNPKDLLKIDDEYMFISNVGLGTTNIGPISFSGDIPLVEVIRGSVGSIASSHLDGTNSRIYRGSYNIVENSIYFSVAPRGSSLLAENEDFANLERAKSEFSGRVFLRDNYDGNIIFDDISESFNGLDTDYKITSLGQNTVGLGTDGGNGLLLINGIFQTPTTENNPNNNFEITEDSLSGITTISFTGITSSNGQIIISESDVNQNQLPRGGLIVSLGSTNGLGYAPLAGAAVTAVVSGGQIIDITTEVEFGSYGSGYREPIFIEIVDEGGHSGNNADIQVSVGAGGSLAFNIIDGGSGYTSPKIIIPSPSYENLPVIGVSRLGIGETTETGNGLLVSLELSPSNTSGIGSTTFLVSNFKIARPGYGFRRGDIIKPVGLVTAAGLASPIKEFELTVLDVFNDSFALWNFGELNYIDSIKNFQDGVRTRFPLFYNSQLLSFQINEESQDSQLIDMASLLLIFVNGVLQSPGEAYEFSGGTSFSFSEPPSPEDNISVFFYVGTANVDSTIVNAAETLKIGDRVKVLRNNLSTSDSNYFESYEQDTRYITDIAGSDRIETSIYVGTGIDDKNYRPISWIKQKRDLIINNSIISKSRDSIETQIYPTSRVIKDFSIYDNEIFVDDVSLFLYDNSFDNNSYNNFDFIIYDENNEYISAGGTALVSGDGTVFEIIIDNFGSGYIGTFANVKFSKPDVLSIGITNLDLGITEFSTSEEVNSAIEQITAVGIVSVTNGSVNYPFTLLNPGLGYTSTDPPKIIIEAPKFYTELISDAKNIFGSTIGITSISTTSGIGVPLAMKFYMDISQFNEYSLLQVGYPVYINGTTIGNGITSIDTSDNDIIGIGTIGLNNIYYIHSIDTISGTIICNILSSTNVTGLSTFSYTYPVGYLNWGKITGFSRTSNNKLSFNVKGMEVGDLSTFPIVQRRGYGLRDSGAIKRSII